MARPLLALTALGAGLGFVAPSVGRGLAPRQAPGTALGARVLDGGSWAPLGDSDDMGSHGYGLERVDDF